MVETTTKKKEKQYPFEYTLSIINAICNWGEEYRPIVDGEVIVHKWHLT